MGGGVGGEGEGFRDLAKGFVRGKEGGGWPEDFDRFLFWESTVAVNFSQRQSTGAGCSRTQERIIRVTVCAGARTKRPHLPVITFFRLQEFCARNARPSATIAAHGFANDGCVIIRHPA